MEDTNLFFFKQIREHFPILKKQINNKPLIYFDNAATTQKPKDVIDAIVHYYENYNSNIDRGFHYLGMASFNEVENTRKLISKFINSEDPSQIIFTSGATEGLNLICLGYAFNNLNEGDSIILSYLEHHSNIIPWQNLSKNKNIKLEFIPLTINFGLDLEAFDRIIKKRPKIVSITYASNALGNITDIEYIIKKTHEYGGIVIIDASQVPSHMEIDIQKINCDFLVFSSHKMYGPTGVGILYGKKHLLDKMLPYKYGGAMVQNISLDSSVFREPPYKFEAGTQNIANIIAFKSAIAFINNIGIDKINNYESILTKKLIEELSNLKEIKIIGEFKNRTPIVSFIVNNKHHLDVGMLLDANGIAVRTGNHCAQPLMKYLNLDGTIRVSLGVYNTLEEIDFFISVLKKILSK